MSKTDSDRPISCYHCGLPVTSDHYHLEDKRFCCAGCKTAFEILNANDLCTYYELGDAPGITPPAGGTAMKFAVLDQPEVVNDLLDFQDGRHARITFNIPDIHCASCVWLLENLYRLLPGIEHSTVEFLKKSVTITYRPDKVNLRTIAELLTSLGYEPRLDKETVQQDADRQARRQLLARIGVAGFAFGNIMLFSLPEYLDLKSALPDSFKLAFSILNFLLSLPVLFYSGWDYFRSALGSLRHRTVNMDVPIALGILTLYIRSVVELIARSGPGWMDSFAGLVFLLLLGKLFQEKTYQALSFDRDYRSYFPLAVTRRSSRGDETIPLKDIRKGDRIVVRNNEIIPADAVLIKGQAEIDYAFVTGEAYPVRLTSGDRVFAGGRQTGGAIELDIVRNVNQSYLTQLWNQDVFQKDSKPGITTLSNTISRYFTLVVLSIAGGAAIYWSFTSIVLSINAFTAVLIVACPCALALSTPFTLGNALRIMGRNGLYLKNTEVIESLASVDTGVFDKTGTLTDPAKSELIFQAVDAEKIGSPPDKIFLMIRALARQSTHPLSRKIYASKMEGSLPDVENFYETPGQGISGRVHNHMVRMGSREFVSGEGTGTALVSEVWVSIDGQVIGVYRIRNRLRPDLESVLKSLGESLDLWMVSGDTENDRNTFQNLFPDSHRLMFRQSPEDKLNFIQKLQSRGRRVLMMGDGLNDAGALKQSEVGISISEDINTFSPACDAILDAQS
ncbi:MAG: HAD-IC family P-type ATPase, partial [FCB group bacterium]|nr:HAD-IC family P-type ATPase [FCB group bacterium]